MLMPEMDGSPKAKEVEALLRDIQSGCERNAALRRLTKIGIELGGDARMELQSRVYQELEIHGQKT